MAVDLRARAIADLAKLEATITRLEEQLRRAHEDRLKVHHFIEMTDRYSQGQEGIEKAASPRRSTSARIRELAYGLLSERRNSVSTAEMTDFIKKSGVQLDVKDPSSYVSSVLSRDERIENIKNKGWCLVDARDQDSPRENGEEYGEADDETQPIVATEAFQDVTDSDDLDDILPPITPRRAPREQPPKDDLDDDIPF